MLFSSITPLPGVSLGNAISLLEAEERNLANLTGSAYDRLASYQNWASQASSRLRYVLDLPQVERLIDTRRHDFLFGMFGGPQQLIHYTVSAEQEDRALTFAAALKELRAVESACATMPEVLLIPDTNIYLHQEERYQDLKWLAIANTTDEIRLFLPMAVMREIDKAKRSPGNKMVSFTNDELVRDRARLTSRHIRQTLTDPEDSPQLAPGITMELLMDPRGHRAIEDPDSEIIDRALLLQTLSGRQVSVVTSDGNMQFGAHVAGLGSILLPG